jgi:hypothetical protein
MKTIVLFLTAISHNFGPALEPTLAPPQPACACQQGGECTCDENCQCQPASTPVSVMTANLVRKLRIDDRSPPSLAPDPNFPETLTAPTPAPIDRAVMVRVYRGLRCQNGVCTPVYEWVPQSKLPAAKPTAKPTAKATAPGQTQPQSTNHRMRRFRLFGR